MKSKSPRAWLLAFVVLALILTACTPAAPQDLKLRVTAMPVLDSIPMYVAEQEGLFAKHGVEVEIVPVGSAPERDQLMASGQVDGMLNEVLSTIFVNQDEVQVQVVRFARSAEQGYPMFSIVAAKDSGITSVADLKGVPVGISDGTVIAYLTDRLLEREGFSPADIATVSVPNISDRMALLSSGELAAATLPEPLTSLAALQGASIVLADTSHPELSNSVYSFRKDVIDQNPAAVQAFLAAIEDAVAAINADRTRWGELLAAKKLVPEPLMATFELPEFVTAGVPTEEQYEDMLDWAEAEGLLRRRVPYADSVNASLLPR